MPRPPLRPPLNLQAEGICKELAACPKLEEEAARHIQEICRVGGLLVPSAFAEALGALRDDVAMASVRPPPDLPARLEALARTARSGDQAERETAGRGLLDGVIGAALECLLFARVAQHAAAADAMERAERLFQDRREAECGGRLDGGLPAATRAMQDMYKAYLEVHQPRNATRVQERFLKVAPR
eukprot:tig00020572_g11554.t1